MLTSRVACSRPRPASLDDDDGQDQGNGEDADVLQAQQQGGPERRYIVDAIEKIRRFAAHSLTLSGPGVRTDPYTGMPGSPWCSVWADLMVLSIKLHPAES
jgi:hypothetical protein